MDRLISEKQVLDAVDKVCRGSVEYRVIYDRCEELIKAIPQAEPRQVLYTGDGYLPIAEIHFDEDKMREICKEVAENLVVEYDFKGKTNGEVIKAVFPNFHTDEMSHTVWVGYDAMSFHRDWWDSPYEPQERSE